MIERILICHAMAPFVRGGAEVLIETLQRELSWRGFQAEVASVPFKWYPKREILKHCLAWRLLDLTESFGLPIDLVIATKFPTYVVKHPNKVTWLLHQFRAAYDLYGTTLSDFSNSVDDRRVREAIREIDCRTLTESRRLFTISQNVSNRLARYNGIQSTPLYPPPPLVGRYRSREYGEYLFTASRLDKLKRIDLMIGALARTRLPVQLWIAGRGSERMPLQQLAVQLGVEDRVRFLGFVPDDELINLYANCRGVVFTPYDEDYGYVTIEAFFSKRPVITTTDAGAPLEFVRHEENGLISQADPAAIAEHLDRLWQDPACARRMGQAGWERVSHISWDQVIEKLVDASATNGGGH